MEEHMEEQMEEQPQKDDAGEEDDETTRSERRLAARRRSSNSSRPLRLSVNSVARTVLQVHRGIRGRERACGGSVSGDECHHSGHGLPGVRPGGG